MKTLAYIIIVILVVAGVWFGITQKWNESIKNKIDDLPEGKGFTIVCIIAIVLILAFVIGIQL